MSLTGREKLLIDALIALPPNSVYHHAEKKTVVKGFRLYTGWHVDDIAWDREKGGLRIIVLDGKPIPVLIFLDGPDVISRCMCETSLSDDKCEHVICALLTVIHLLRPHLFRMAAENPGLRDRLLAGLWKNSSEERVALPSHSNVVFLAPRRRSRETYLRAMGTGHAPNFQVVIEEVKGRLKAYVESQGMRIEAPVDAQSLPAGLAYLAGFSGREDVSVPLSIFLRKWGHEYTVVLREGRRSHRIDWGGDVPCNTWTEFDTSKEEVFVKKGCSMADDPVPATLLGNFAFDVERTRMCYVRERQGWEPWNVIRDACLRGPHIAAGVREKGSSTLVIPKEVFTGFELSFEKPVDGQTIPSVTFKTNGKDMTPPVVEASVYRISIARRHSGGEEYVITPECMTEDCTFAPSRRVLTLVRAVEWGHVPVSIRTRKRKPILYDMFFQAFALKKNRKILDEALKKAINERSFGKSRFATLARRLIRESVAESKVEEMRLQFTGKKWQFTTADRERELLLFSVPYRVFGPRLFEKVILDDSTMVVGEEELLGSLHALNTLAREEGIEVLLDGHAVEPAVWEFELDAREGSIDWFEIRPEIRCNGQTIDRGLWEQALRKKGVFHRDGTMQVLDEKVMETLSAIALLGDGLSKRGKAVPGEIVMVPRLRIIEFLSLRKRGITVHLAPEDEAVMERLTSFERIEEKALPEGLKGDLRRYQQEGYRWLAFLYENRFGACLADDMGLGKTIQALTLLAAIREGKVTRTAAASAPSLIVLPPSLVFNWEQEIERFCPGLKVYVYRGRDRSTNLKGYDVVLTSYGLVRRDIARLKDIRFNVIIFDEAQTIKNIFAGTTGAVRQLKGLFKVALTGTPVENHIGEYFSIMDLVLPGLLGDYKEFQGRAKQDMTSFLSAVTERTRPFLLRRTKERIMKELPPKVERDVYLDLTEKQKRFYNKTVEEVRSTIDNAYGSKAASQARIVALTAIMKLRQICLTPELLVPAQKEISPKVEFLREKLDELCSESHSSLVFSQFTSFLDVVEEELRAKHFRIFRLDGSTPMLKRKEIVEGFQGCEGPSVFLLSLKAGGQGLNLTRATYVFHLDPWWNPAVENQASDRSHRIGQKNKVIVTRLLMRHTVEEKMMALKERKQSLYRALMDSPEKSAGSSITRDDFNFLLG